MNWQELLIACAWRATVILAAAFAAGAVLRRASAATRHFVWTAAFAALLILPAAMPLAPKWGIVAAPAEVPSAPPVAPLLGGTAPRVAGGVPARPQAAAGRPFLLDLWMLGCVVCALRFLLGAMYAWRMDRRSAEADYAGAMLAEYAGALGIRRPVRIRESASAPTALAWGILRPVVLLPRGAGEWPRARLEAAVLHELAHIQRLDLAAQALAQAACCLFWFHPLAWIGARQLRRSREQACDDAVLRRGIAAPDYAGRLLELARSLAARGRSWADAPAMAELSDLESRVRALLDGRRNRQPLSRRAAAAVAAGGLAVLVAAAAITAHAQTQRGVVAGVVQDASGARVPNCEVAAKNLEGSNEEITRANQAGEYRFASLPAGRYTLEFRSPGFALTRKNLTVAPGAVARFDAWLELGQVSESVVVTGKKPPVVQLQPYAPQRIRVGGNVQATKLIYHVAPVYPADLQQRGIEGTVVLRAVISKQGDLLNLVVASAEVDQGLAKAALDAVQQWRYQPTLLNGQPVEVVTTISVAFRLE